MYFRRRGLEPDGVGVRVHAATGEELPPPVEPDTLSVSFGDTIARYTPERSELEWIDDGVYRSVTADGFTMARLIEIARSVQR